MRRTTATAYEEAISIRSATDVENDVRVVERVLDQLGDNDTQWAATQTKRIHRELGRAGITIEADPNHFRPFNPPRHGAKGSLGKGASPRGRTARLRRDLISRRVTG